MDNSYIPEIPPNGKKAVFTVTGVAAAGALIGSLIPVFGTVIGAGIGGIAGGIGVIASEVKNRKTRN